MDYVRGLGELRCTVAIDGKVVSNTSAQSEGLPAGPLRLSIHGDGETQQTAGAVLAIDRIAVGGVTSTQAPTATAWSTGARHWVNRAPGLAVQAWKPDELEPEQRIARAIAQAASGDLPAAVRSLPSWPEDSAPHTLLSAIRSDPLRVGLLLATVDPALPIQVMDQATPIAQGGHASEEWLGLLLDQAVTGLESPRPHESLDTRTQRLRLLLARGRVFRAAGSAQAGLQDLRRVLELIGDDSDVPQLRPIARVAHIRLALALAADGDEQSALGHARAAIDGTDAKVRERDHLRTRDELTPYRDLPEWRALLDDGPELLLDGTERRPSE